MIRDTLDGLTIDWDEDGAHLRFSGERAVYDLRVRDLPMAEMIVSVIQSELGSWVSEAHSAAVAVVKNVPEESGYDLSDPKHPTYYERMSALWDDREKT